MSAPPQTSGRKLMALAYGERTMPLILIAHRLHTLSVSQEHPCLLQKCPTILFHILKCFWCEICSY